MDRDKVHDLEDEFPFGKYKGKTIQDVLEINPSYIVWFYENVKRFKILESIYDEACDAQAVEKFNRRIGGYLHRYIENSPYWFEDDNGSWLS